MAGVGRIAFLGTGAFGVPLLRRVAELADDLVVISQPDRPAGRRLQLRATPVTAFAREHGIPVMTPNRLRSSEARDALRAYAPDGLVLVAYGQLVPQDLLDIAERPPLNVHPSLLPRHRGAAPVAGTILAGDREGGVTLMVMTADLDAGPIVGRWPVPLGGRETTPELEATLADLAAQAVPPELERWASGGLDPVAQDDALAT
ncbi:MAG: methionyl-tRNA formyltransferase, partial [Candidatus Limnocylindria bacterium]